MTAADTRAPATTLVGRAQANVVFGTVALAVLMSALDQTIVSTALPTIIADLGGAGHMSWVVTSYLLSAAVATALAGKFGDLFGRKLIFQLSTAIFIAGSLVAGMAHGMSLLIVGRAIQGVGAGGLLVTSMALIADVIPLRERGKYQGGLGAVFGVATVVGPTLGGLFTDHASWRWCFYVNIPLALIMIIVAARAIPTMRAPAKPTIDYAGIGLIAVGVSCLILGLEWGGQEYAWGSATIVGLFVAAAVLVAAFVLVEQRAAEPMLPMRLFRGNVFAVCSILSFVVGFAMLGVLTYLPAYLQFVDGISATASGVRTLPLVAGLLVTSVISGQVAGKTGRYKIFPIAGTAVMAVGLLLMSTMGRGTSTLRESLYMLVLGLGLGLAMQVLTIVVQNTVPYTDLGTATAGVTFFRTIGGAFGTAIFGSLYASQLGPNLNAALAQVPEVPHGGRREPAAFAESATGAGVSDHRRVRGLPRLCVPLGCACRGDRFPGGLDPEAGTAAPEHPRRRGRRGLRFRHAGLRRSCCATGAFGGQPLAEAAPGRSAGPADPGRGGQLAHPRPSLGDRTGPHARAGTRPSHSVRYRAGALDAARGPGTGVRQGTSQWQCSNRR